MRIVTVLVVPLWLLVAALVLPQDANAWPGYFDDYFIAKYPSWPHQSQPGSCLVCHTILAVPPAPMPRNAYGLAFAAAKAGSNPAAALTAIAGQDSDGDGVPNEVEILLGSYPGNAASKPAVPGGVSASDATFADRVQLAWSPYPNATFQVHRGDSVAGPQALLASPSSSPYADTTAVPGKTYYYWLKACRGAWCTDLSAPDAGMRKVAEAPPQPAGPPATPTGVKASDGTYADKVRVSWSAVSGAGYYYVQRAEAPDFAGETKSWAAAGTQFDDTTAEAGKTYHYRVFACPPQGACGVASAPDTGLRAGGEQGRVALQRRTELGEAKVLVPGAPLQKALSPKLGVEYVTARCYGKNYQSGGQGLPISWLQVSLLSAGANCVIDVRFKNSGLAKSEAGTVTLKVTGGKKVKTYESSYNQTFKEFLPSVGPNQTVVINVSVNVTDPGPYLFQADWTPK
jgi:hypothetical protein